MYMIHERIIVKSASKCNIYIHNALSESRLHLPIVIAPASCEAFPFSNRTTRTVVATVLDVYVQVNVIDTG